MEGTQGVGELGQNLSLGPQTNHQRIDKVLGSRVLRYGLVLVGRMDRLDEVHRI